MLTWWRLVYRLQAPGILFSAALCLGLTAAAAWLTFDMRSMLAGCGSPDEPNACNVIFAFQNTHGQSVMMVQMGIGLAMYGVPLVLGVPILTREIEQRTAMIAWPLAGSRLKWLAWRVVPVLVVGMTLIGIMAFGADQLARVYFPHSDIGFTQYESRGLPLVMRGSLMLVAGVAVGALLGRLLPSLLTGIGLAIALSTALGAAVPHWVPSADLTADEVMSYTPGVLFTDVQYRLADGRLISAQDGEILVQELYEENGGEEPDPALMPQQVLYGIAAERYPEVIVRETAVLAAATVGVTALAALVVRRRRPE